MPRNHRNVIQQGAGQFRRSIPLSMRGRRGAPLPIWFELARVQHGRLHCTIRIECPPEQTEEDRCIWGMREEAGRFATQQSVLRPWLSISSLILDCSPSIESICSIIVVFFGTDKDDFCWEEIPRKVQFNVVFLGEFLNQLFGSNLPTRVKQID